MILLGGTASFIFGIRGSLSLDEGEAKSRFFDKSGRERPLGFSVLLDDFWVERYASGQEWLMVFLRENKESLKMRAEAGESGWIALNPGENKGYAFQIIQKSVESGRPFLLVEVKDPMGRKKEVILSADAPPAEVNTPENLTLSYAVSGAPVKSLKSVLRIQEEGKKVSTRTVEVGRPLRHQGYGFYQSAADPANDDRTELKVINDTGAGIVYAGFLLFMGGMLLTFCQNLYFLPRSSPKRRK